MCQHLILPANINRKIYDFMRCIAKQCSRDLLLRCINCWAKHIFHKSSKLWSYDLYLIQFVFPELASMQYYKLLEKIDTTASLLLPTTDSAKLNILIFSLPEFLVHSYSRSTYKFFWLSIMVPSFTTKFNNYHLSMWVLIFCPVCVQEHKDADIFNLFSNLIFQNFSLFLS